MRKLRNALPALIISTAALLCLLLSGCDQAAMMKRLVPEENEKVAQYYIGLLREGDFAPIERDMDPSIKSPDLHDVLVKMAKLLPAGEPTSVKAVGANTFFMHMLGGVTTQKREIDYEYQFTDSWVLVNFTTQIKGDLFTIIGFRVTPIPDSLENMNRFTLTGKSYIHYLFLVLAVFIPLYILYWLVVCIRTKGQKRKWLWILFILAGVGKLSINWTSGQLFITPLTINLLGASAMSPFYGPWTIAIAFPLGAFLYMLRRDKPGGNINQEK